IIATSLALCAVFIPVATISGLTGQFYRQFAVTIAISTVISTINSLTLSPAMSALLLRSHDAPKDAITRFMDATLNWFFVPFNKFFKRSSEGYSRSVGGVLRHKTLSMAIYFILIFVTFGLFHSVPGGFVPAQDKQYLVGFAQLPDGASLERTDKVIRQMSQIAMDEPGVQNAVAFPGLSIAGFSASSSAGIVFLPLDPFDKREGGDLSADAIAGRLNEKFGAISEAFIAVFPPPP